MNGRVVAGVVLLAVSGVLLFALGPGDEAGDVTLPAGGATVLAGPTTCLPCHANVVTEWRDSMHAESFTDPQVRAPDQSDNFRKTECLPCHTPRPLFEHGIEPGARVLARVERRADGVDCLSCHGLPADDGGGVAASRAGLTGACRPTLRTELSTHFSCAACHDQHNTNQEWLVSPAAARGDDCISCHMPRVQRSGAEVGAPRAGRSHRFLGGRDEEFTLQAIDLTHELSADGRTLTARLHNRFAGHNLPTDSRNRALDLVVTLFDAHGRALGPPPGTERESWEQDGTARRRFRNPYRSSGAPSTQLPAGETASVSVEVPATAVRAVIGLHYKLQPFVRDDSAHWSRRIEVDLD